MSNLKDGVNPLSRIKSEFLDSQASHDASLCYHFCPLTSITDVEISLMATDSRLSALGALKTFYATSTLCIIHILRNSYEKVRDILPVLQYTIKILAHCKLAICLYQFLLSNTHPWPKPH